MFGKKKNNRKEIIKGILGLMVVMFGISKPEKMEEIDTFFDQWADRIIKLNEIKEGE